jgi:hypothetical protein
MDGVYMDEWGTDDVARVREEEQQRVRADRVAIALSVVDALVANVLSRAATDALHALSDEVRGTALVPGDAINLAPALSAVHATSRAAAALAGQSAVVGETTVIGSLLQTLAPKQTTEGALGAAIRSGNLDLVKRHLAQWPDLSKPDTEDNGNHALHLAAGLPNERSEALQLLLRTPGVDVNCRNRDGATALHLAVYRGHLASARMLVAFGADCDARNAQGVPPAMLLSLLLEVKGASGAAVADAMRSLLLRGLAGDGSATGETAMVVVRRFRHEGAATAALAALNEHLAARCASLGTEWAVADLPVFAAMRALCQTAKQVCEQQAVAFVRAQQQQQQQQQAEQAGEAPSSSSAAKGVAAADSTAEAQVTNAVPAPSTRAPEAAAALAARAHSVHFERALMEVGGLLSKGRARLEAPCVPAAAAALDLQCYCRVKRLFDSAQGLFFEGRLQEAAVSLQDFAAVLRGDGGGGDGGGGAGESGVVAVDGEGVADAEALVSLEDFFRRACVAEQLPSLFGLFPDAASAASPASEPVDPAANGAAPPMTPVRRAASGGALGDDSSSSSSSSSSSADGGGTTGDLDGFAWSPQRSAARTVDPESRRQLVEFYATHASAKLSQVDALLSCYSKSDLSTSLRERYGTVPMGWGTAAEEAWRQRQRELVAFYRRMDPTRLGRVHDLLMRFSVPELRSALWRKYGELPVGTSWTMTDEEHGAAAREAAEEVEAAERKRKLMAAMAAGEDVLAGARAERAKREAAAARARETAEKAAAGEGPGSATAPPPPVPTVAAVADMGKAAPAQKARGTMAREQQLMAFYERHEPIRAELPTVQALLANYTTEDALLEDALLAKYGELPQGWGRTQTEEDTSAIAVVGDQASSPQTNTAQELQLRREQLADFYR